MKGWDDAHLRSEACSRGPCTSGVAGEIFTVKLASTGERWPVPADKTIAQVQENGVDVPLSCEMGICGACLTPVIDGVVDHGIACGRRRKKAHRTSRWRCAVPEAIPGN